MLPASEAQLWARTSRTAIRNVCMYLDINLFILQFGSVDYSQKTRMISIL